MSDDESAEPELLYRQDGDIGVITSNRPAARNALTWRTYAMLGDALRTTTARCLVITGAELFVMRGLVCDVPGLGRLSQLIGRERAAEMLFTGEIIDASEALRIGLVGRVVHHDELLDTAMELAARVAANPPLAVQRLKAGLRTALDPDWHELGSWVSSSLSELFTTDDHREGVKAFLEKRVARFEGR